MDKRTLCGLLFDERRFAKRWKDAEERFFLSRELCLGMHGWVECLLKNCRMQRLAHMFDLVADENDGRVG